MRCCYFITFIVLFCSLSLRAQVKSEDDLKKQAELSFENEEYNVAYKHYAQLVSLYPKDPEYNYKLGVCMLYTEPDKKKPYSYFQIALKNPAEAPKDAKFFLAKTYHVNYRFDEALKLYTEYKATASSASIKKYQVDREIQACKNGKRLLSNLTDLVVISKKQLNDADYFKAYDVKEIGGKLLVKPDEYKSGYDKKKKDKSVVYLPRTAERLYYSSYGEGGGNGRDIYYVNKLPNGTWSKPTQLPSIINTEFDEDYPFLHPNGKTLYFSSKGHNSMGGYDVFKTTFNVETQTWSKPENLEFPINSPDDDVLFVTDSLEKTAYFSTGRYSPYGKLDVLKINTERRPMNFAVVKGGVVKEEASQSVKSKITVKNMANGEIVGTFAAQDNGEYNMELPNGGKFIFTVETPGLPTQSDGVQIPVAYTLKPYRQVISYDKKILKIINYFDGSIADENYSMMIDFIEKKAKLEVNENEPYNNSLLKDPAKTQNNNNSNANNLNSVSTTNPTIQGNDSQKNTTDANNNKNVTNEQLLSIAKIDAKEAEEEAKKLKADAQDAFGLATQKTAESVAKQKDAEQAIEKANAITDVNVKNDQLAKANILKEEAKIAGAVANTATNMAKKLEVDAEMQQKEADLTNQYITQLETVIKNKNNKEALTKLENIQKELDDISNQKNQSSELLTSLKAESDLKQQELIKSEKKSNSITNEINALKNESQTLEQDLANENDKAVKENISAQIRELKSEIDTKNNELSVNNQKIESLKNEVEGVNQELQIAAKILNEPTDGVAINNSPNKNTNNSTNINNNTTTNNGNNQSAGIIQNNSGTNSALSYEGITNKYADKLNSTTIDKANKESVTQQNEILKTYNREVNDLLAVNKNELTKTNDPNTKKKLNEEIKSLEKLKADNEKTIAANNTTLKQLETNVIASNQNPSSQDNSQINNTSVNNSNNNSNSISNNSNPSNTSATNQIENTQNNSTDTRNNIATNNNNNTNTLGSNQQINNSANPSSDTGNTIFSNTSAPNEATKTISPNSANDNTAFLNELNNLKNSLNSNSDAANQIFGYNDYKETTSVSLKQTAKDKFELANQSENNLKNTIARTETAIKNNSSGNSEVLLSEAENLNNKAYEQRKESVTKTGAEKDALLKQATENEQLSNNKKLEAANINQKQNKAKFENNALNLAELQKLTGTKTSDAISQANMLIDEAALNFKQAQKLRAEADAYPSGSAKLGGLSNAEEKENEALLKQQKAQDILVKANPTYQLKTLGTVNDPTSAIAVVNDEINKTNQLQLDAYLALSKANQNELTLQTDKLLKNPAFKSSNNKPAQDLKTKADNLNNEAKTLISQSTTAKTASEKANILLRANEKEIEAIKNLAQAAELTKNNNSLAANSNSNSNNTPVSSTQLNNNDSNASSQRTANNSNFQNTSQNNQTTESNNSQAINNNSTQTNSQTNSISTNSNSSNTNSNTISNNAANNNNADNTQIANNSNINADNNSSAIVNGNGVGDEAAKLKLGLNSNAESTLANYNNYTETQAIALKNDATSKLNTALEKDKQLIAELDNVVSLSGNSGGNLSQQNISTILSEAEKLNDDAAALRKLAVTKSGLEKENDLNEAKKLEANAITKKVDAANKQKQLNLATFEANKQSLAELAEMAKGKNISELSSADMITSEAEMFLKQGKRLREEANAYPSDAAKLGGYSNAEEKELQALFKQQSLLDIYKKNFPAYTPKKAVVSSDNPEAVSKFNTAKSDINTNDQLHVDALNLLVQANEKEYQTRLKNLPNPLNNSQTAIKNKAQESYRKSQDYITKSNQTSNISTKKALLTDAVKTGQEAIDNLNQIEKTNSVASNNSANNSNQNSTTNSTNANSQASTQGNNARTNENNNASGNVASATNPSNSNVSGNTANNTNSNPSANSNTPSNNTRNNNTASNSTANNSSTVVNLKVEGLEIKTNNAYTADKPIPIDEKIPDGLVFKVQIGAFKAALPNNTFKGLSPVIAQTTPSGYIRYMAGNFEQYASANAVKNDLRNLGYTDAFVVAYYNGKRINLNEATEKAKEVGQAIEPVANTTAGITANSNVPRNTFTQPTNTLASNVIDSQPVEIANELEKMNGLLYTVQIGVYSKQVTRSQLYNLKPIYTEKLPNGLYRYTAGIYNQSQKLLEDKRKVVDLGVKDAFVSAYYNAKRIPFAEGQKLQAENNNLKMETENPIIFSGSTALAPVTNNTTANNTATIINPTPSVAAFSNGIANGPEPTAENGVKTDETGISYKVQIGAYKNQVPNEVASKFLNIKTWPVKNVVINGLYIYTIGNFTGMQFAKNLKDEAIGLGIADAYITVYKDGKKLYGAEASQYLGR